MPIKLTNNASGTLATAISASDTGLVLTTGDGAEFPTLGATDYFYATITSTQGTQEIVKVTARVGDSMTIVRAQEGTTAAGFAPGARFELRVTVQAIKDVSRYDQWVSVKDFGVVGDGVTDDTAAITAAINSGARDVLFPDGTYKITNKITITSNDVGLHGDAKVLIAVNDDYGFVISTATRLEVDGLFFDGNHTAKGAFDISVLDNVRVSNCTFYDFRTATYVYSIVGFNIKRMVVENCLFEKLWAVDGVGDNGVIRALYLASTHGNTVIRSCTFKDINNVTSGDVLSYQDADAIQCYVNPATSPEPVQNIVVTDCYFENCGKRAVKFQGQEKSVYVFENSRVVSSWTSVDAASLVGMYSVASHYGGNLSIYNVTLKDGACIYLVDGQVAAQVYLSVDGCYFEPEAHTTVRGEIVQAVLLDASLSTNLRTTITNNVFRNIKNAVYSARNLTCIGNQFVQNAAGGTMIFPWGGYAVVANNNLVSAGTSGEGIYFRPNEMDGFMVTGNHITGFNDAIYLTAQAVTTFGSVVGNVCVGYGRAALFGETNSNNTLISANYQNTAPRSENISIVTATATNIASAANIINTNNKRQGKMVYDTTNNRIMIASGATAVSAWYVADGSASVVPA
jgi:hypothetical protein